MGYEPGAPTHARSREHRPLLLSTSQAVAPGSEGRGKRAESAQQRRRFAPRRAHLDRTALRPGSLPEAEEAAAGRDRAAIVEGAG